MSSHPYKCFLIAFTLFLSFLGHGQFRYNIPTHYQGIFDLQRTSTRALGMGLTTVTLEGIESSFYNPASIGLTKETLNVHVNYASGSQVYKNGQFPFVGVSYRLNDKLVIGASTYHWIDDKETIWTTIIGNFDEAIDGSRSQSMFNLMAAYEVIPNLNLGLSGNYLVARAVPGNVTNETIFLSLGAVYDLEVDWIRVATMSDQRIRFAMGWQNILMKNQIEQTFEEFLNYRGLAIYLHLGAAYNFTLPLRAPFRLNGNYFKNATQDVTIGLHLQYRNALNGKEERFHTLDGINNSFGIGAEAWFFDRFVFRMGYYNEQRPSGQEPGEGTWLTDNKRGFTWGYGALIPTHDISKGSLPFNTEVNFVTSSLLNVYSDNITVPSYFTDDNFLFAFGLNLKFVDKKPPSTP